MKKFTFRGQKYKIIKWGKHGFMGLLCRVEQCFTEYYEREQRREFWLPRFHFYIMVYVTNSTKKNLRTNQEFEVYYHC